MRPTQAVIHLEHLKHNIEEVRTWTAHRRPDHPPPRLCVAVKADAYGHGIVEVARTAAECDTEYLAVATVDEAVQVREAGIALPLLLYSLPGRDEIPFVVSHRITPLVTDAQYARALGAESRKQGLKTTCHIKVDTGMGRIGCTPEAAPALAHEILAHHALSLGGVSTHYPVADSSDPTYTEEQTHRFAAVIASLRSAGIDPGVVHAANSGGVLQYPDGYFDMVRPGLVVYGYYPATEMARPLDLKPVMELRSQLVFVKRVPAGTPISYGHTYRTPRETYIGTVPCGYADGYSRSLSNRAEVWVDGRRRPVVGRVCMDQMMIDLGPGPPPQRYSDVVLFGPKSVRAGSPDADLSDSDAHIRGEDIRGEDVPDAAELAELCETIPYEITCGVSKRVPRVYTGEISP